VAANEALTLGAEDTMRFLVLFVLAALAGGCGSGSDCEYGVCNYGPDRPESWCARADHQCYAEDAPGYTP
jgi:hypothetical protein